MTNNSGTILQLAEIELFGTPVSGNWTANWIQGPNNSWLSFGVLFERVKAFRPVDLEALLLL